MHNEPFQCASTSCSSLQKQAAVFPLTILRSAGVKLMPLHTFLLSISPPLLFSSAGLARILSARPGVTPGVAWIWPLACRALSSGGRRNPAKYSALKQGSNACPPLPLSRDLLPLQSPRGPCPSARAPASAAKYFPLGSFLIRKKNDFWSNAALQSVCFSHKSVASKHFFPVP